MNLRKIIRESIATAANMSGLKHSFVDDIHYLKDFYLLKKENKGDSTIWVYEHKEKDYTIRTYIQNDKSKNAWSGKIFIYWKSESKDYTNAKGKDFDMSFGPYNSYEELVNELNRKLKNHPNISSENYMDNDNTQFNKDLVAMTKHMVTQGEKIDAVKDIHFKDLKKIYKEVKDIKTDKELTEFYNDKAPDEEDKQTLLLTMQKIYQLDFYLNKEKLESLF